MSETSPDKIDRSIVLRAPRSRVWRALTDAAEFGEWFRAKLEGAFTVGQRTRGTITHPGFEHVAMELDVVRMEGERLFAFRWHPYAVEPGVDYSSEPMTLVEFHLEDVEGGTHLRVTESGFDQLPPERRATAFRMNDGGWAQQLENIRQHVEA
ncbi:SRPBCC family protein [Vulgatibacter incomptus]|uniref:Activator of Hsp90 ATPase homologue 1/2-like C-terminal domain-containing protein n=1 Tax=Vulgatibacter incomptus TaxID=1391653 RepID=A0A0K1PGL4_9BACT|nr:SRPBCC family protein [Vulgatibacter incomptus]AKU92561.1 hypothetical protein AKJ08_2948 [Vulgatibacter incomptus]